MNVAVIKYNAGNIRSVDYALKRLGLEAEITDDKEAIMRADKVIFPGVGEAGTTMKHLRITKMDQVIRDLKQPVLGICLGLQLMCEHSEEGDTTCLGIFDEHVKKFIPHKEDANVKVPHMGWNSLHDLKGPLFKGDFEGQYVYFVHSFYAGKGKHTAATTNYILNYSSALQKDNFYATQFHPEKSGPVGEKILQNFIDL